MNNFSLALSKCLKTYVLDFTYADSYYLIKADNKLVNNLIFFLKKYSLTRLDTLYDISAYVNPNTANKNKFTIYYYLFSVKYNVRAIIITQLFNELSFIKSVASIFKSSIWLEREIWDMFGIFFTENKDLRRLLTDYGFKYNPLLKEFPLKGYFELKYYDSKAVLQHVKVTDQQQPKIYDFKNPWKFFYSFNEEQTL